MRANCAHNQTRPCPRLPVTARSGSRGTTKLKVLYTKLDPSTGAARGLCVNEAMRHWVRRGPSPCSTSYGCCFFSSVSSASPKLVKFISIIIHGIDFISCRIVIACLPLRFASTPPPSSPLWSLLPAQLFADRLCYRSPAPPSPLPSRWHIKCVNCADLPALRTIKKIMFLA